MKIAFVMDPVESVDIDADTTFAFMESAYLRDHEVYYLGLHDLWAQGGEALADAHRAHLRREYGNHVDLEPKTTWPLTAFDAIFMRKDPPFNIAYLHAVHLLELAEEAGVLVLNSPAGLRAANEKLYALHFPHAIPTTIVTSVPDRIRSFIEEQPGKRAVLKPVDGHGGEGIFVVESGDRNLNVILEVMTMHGRERVMVQEYLPAARQGDKRVILLDGEPLGAILRVPRDNEHRGNIHAGGKVVQSSLTSKELEICESIAPRLRQDGLYFVGLDFIGERLTEVNVTSPTGIQELSRLDEIDGAGKVVDFIERNVSETSNE